MAFSAAERKALIALARAAFPAGRRAPAVDPSLADRVERFLEGAPADARWFLRAVLWTVEWAAVLRHGRRLTRLADEIAREYVEGWTHSGFLILRLCFRALISPLKIVHYGEPQVAKALGYDPPPETTCAHPSPVPVLKLAKAEGRVRCEVAVIGSGAGGATVAKELAERGRDVVLLEEGDYVPSRQFNRRPLDMAALLYRDLGMTMALGRGAGIPVPLGKAVGGTTTINSGTCFRVPAHVLDRWRSIGDLDLRPEDLAPDYERVERFIEVAEVPEEILGNSARVVRRGAEKLGLHGHPLKRNARHCKGSGVCCFGCPTEAKRSANVSWVPAAVKAGTRLFAGVKADRIEIGARHLVHAGALEIEADAVVISAGTLHSPSLLFHSGIRHPALGRNVSIHPACKASALFEEEIRGWEGVPQGFGIHDLHREGILFEGIFTPPEFGAFALPFVGSRLTEVMEQYAHMAAFGFLIEDRSVGVLRLGTGRPQLFYELGAPEMEKLRRGVEMLARIFFAAGAREVFAPVAGFESLKALGDVERLRTARLNPAMFELSAFHPLGSCRASRDPSRGVVDEQLEAHDAQRLFVVDGSVFPSSLAVNPQLTIMAFAQRAARHVDARLSGAPRC
ncbi:MAG: GMC family oxidoreductase [Myxococcales bacterium]|nr:GMC family oxidoreductase [Myxococcales bacterium]